MFVFEWWRERRIKYRKVPLLSEFIRPRTRVLDLGAGNGQVAEAVQLATNAELTLLDVVYYNKTALTLHTFDGRRIPYPDNYFDQTIIIFVLHHISGSADQENLLREATRVTKNEIILWEDTPRNWLEMLINRIVDWSINTYTFSGVHIPHSYRSHHDWKSLFRRLGLRVDREIVLRDFIFFFGGYAQQIYVLSKLRDRS